MNEIARTVWRRIGTAALIIGAALFILTTLSLVYLNGQAEARREQSAKLLCAKPGENVAYCAARGEH